MGVASYKRDFFVTVFEHIEKWPANTGTYEHHGLGFAEFTLEAAHAEARRMGPSSLANKARAWGYRIARSCQVCNLSGIAPKCKVKRCPACSGRGTIDIAGEGDDFAPVAARAQGEG